MKYSRVVRSSDEKNCIRKFFENKTIKGTALLYRASENGFCIRKFHEKCDGVSNTLTLITTQFNNKIGGFTPLKWKSTTSGSYCTDNSKESFIFSLTHNDKFTLTLPEYAIFNRQDYGPAFGGGHDLIIYDKSN